MSPAADDRHSLARAAAAVTALLVGACSSTAPVAPDAGTGSCAELRAAIAQAQGDADAARERKADAWKLVVPVAVLARRAQAGNELEAAEQRLAALRARPLQRECGDGL